jgi:ABC-type transport system involved in cytochrome bd biosynthesis fused ATPase/permease subunit
VEIREQLDEVLLEPHAESRGERLEQHAVDADGAGLSGGH